MGSKAELCPISVDLSATPAKGGGVGITLTFRNDSTGTIRLWNGFAPGNHEPRGDWFQVTGNGQRLPYLAPRVKRPPPPAEDFTALAPGRTVTSRLLLTDDQYGFRAGMTVTLRFEAINSDVGDQQIISLSSNEMTLRLP